MHNERRQLGGESPQWKPSEGEWADWYALSPQQRWEKTLSLWEVFLFLGGSLDPEPDSQSPFYDPETYCPSPFDGRTGMRVIRRGGV